MLDNISKMTKENVEAFVTGLQNGDTAEKDFRRYRHLGTHTFTLETARTCGVNRFLEMTFSFNRSVIFSEGKMKNLDIVRCGRRWLKRLQQIA